MNHSKDLVALVASAYDAASTTEALTFSDTELSILPLGSKDVVVSKRIATGELAWDFQLRWCPALAKKPNQGEQKKDVKNYDPFEDPPKQLLITVLPDDKNPTHILVLNKYPVIRNHFIIATKLNKQQTQLLEPSDVEATFGCLRDWEASPSNHSRKPLFAFFNSGVHSGASQNHRHLQFLPVQDMQHQQQGNQHWNLLADEVLSHQTDPNGLCVHPGLPFVHFGLPIPSQPDSATLFSIYQRLCRAARASVDEYIARHPGMLELHKTENDSSPYSYNLAMTSRIMMICPRKREGDVLRRDDGSEVGFISLNGTILAGTLMVKQEEEWDILRDKPAKLQELLRSCCLPIE